MNLKKLQAKFLYYFDDFMLLCSVMVFHWSKNEKDLYLEIYNKINKCTPEYRKINKCTPEIVQEPTYKGLGLQCSVKCVPALTLQKNFVEKKNTDANTSIARRENWELSLGRSNPRGSFSLNVKQVQVLMINKNRT